MMVCGVNMKMISALLLLFVANCRANECGAQLTSSNLSTPSGWYMCYTDIQDGHKHTDCENLIKDINAIPGGAVFPNASALLAAGGNFGCYRTRGGIQSVDVRRACRDYFQHDSALNTNCPSCKVFGVCIRPPVVFACNFSSGDWCGMRQSSGGHHNWTMHIGATSSGNTGPSKNDHYIYFETSDPVATGQYAGVETPVLSASRQQACLGLDFHMYGANMGKLYGLLGTSLSSARTRLFSYSGDKGNAWHHRSQDISLHPGDRVILQAVRGSDYKSDIAIDNIKVTSGSCSQTDECSSSPCRNGGHCIDSLNAYFCNCTEAFIGDNCEIPVTSVMRTSCDTRAVYVTVNTSAIDLLLQGVDPASMYVGNVSCSGTPTANGTRLDWRVPLDECLTERQETDTHITYSNTLLTGMSNDSDVITTHPWAMKLNCRLRRHRHLASQMIPFFRNPVFTRTFEGNISVRMTLYTNRTSTLSTFPARVNVEEKIYVDIDLLSSADDLRLGLRRMYGTPTNETMPVNDRLNLIDDNCPVSDLASVNPAGNTQLRFSFRMFKFPAHDSVFVHFMVALCVSNSLHTNTSRTCDRQRSCISNDERTRRAVPEDHSAVYELSAGPFVVGFSNIDDPTTPTGISIELSTGIAVGTLLVGLLLGVLVSRRRGRGQQPLSEALTSHSRPLPTAEPTYTDIDGATASAALTRSMHPLPTADPTYTDIDGATASAAPIADIEMLELKEKHMNM